MLSLTANPNRKEGVGLADFCAAARILDVPVSRIRAVDAVESAGRGFLPSGRPKILFEGHLFHKFTGGQFSKTFPTISYPRWTKQFYKGGEAEYSRLELAYKLDPTAALRATSWGRFQILGDNFKNCGFKSVADFVSAMFVSESLHLSCFAVYARLSGLLGFLKSGDYAGFAAGYNGPGYKRNQYDTKIAAAEEKFAAQKIDCRNALASTTSVEAAMPADCHGSCTGLNNTSFDDRYTVPTVDSDRTEADGTQHQPALSSPSKTDLHTDSTSTSDPNTPLAGQAGASVPFSETVNKTIDKATAAQGKIDSVAGIIDRYTGKDSLKSVVTIVVSKIVQLFLFFFAIFDGISFKYWAVIAVILFLLSMMYLFRQTWLGYIREKSSAQ